MAVVQEQQAILDFDAERKEHIVSACVAGFEKIKNLSLEAKVDVLNRLRLALHELSPFKAEPVDCVQWIKADYVTANDYNPNSVAPPEMELLRHSIKADGYTQPIVSWLVEEGSYEVVDGFHRHRVGRELPDVRKRVHGYLPLVVINEERQDRNDRIAATIRHNRARGKHRVEAMSDIVVELKRRNWADDRICRELGMDQDEVLRLCQITGLADLFSDQEFSKSWDVEGEVTEADFAELSDDPEDCKDEKFRTVNTNDEGRIFHTYDKWECYKAGLYATTKEGMTKKQCEEAYRDFLADIPRFEDALKHVITEWKNSCEHYLTNAAMNRIAWLGQASACYAMGMPNQFRGGFFLLSLQQQDVANRKAWEYLNKWLEANCRQPVPLEEALADKRQSDLY
jgi:ParB-like chromosome segregation protein Spo0J